MKEPAIKIVMMPKDTNAMGTIFGALAELLVDRFALPAVIWAARTAAPHHEGIALALYRKIYQSTKRIAMRAEFARAGGSPARDR